MKTHRRRICRMRKQARKYFKAEASVWFRDEVWADKFFRTAHPDLARQAVHLKP